MEPGPGLSPGEWQLRCPLPLTQAPGTRLSTILSTRDTRRGKLSPVSQRSISFHTHRNELSNIFMAPVYFVLKQNRKCRKLTGYIPSTVTKSSLHTFYIYIPKQYTDFQLIAWPLYHLSLWRQTFMNVLVVQASACSCSSGISNTKSILNFLRLKSQRLLFATFRTEPSLKVYFLPSAGQIINQEGQQQ